jgi:hypothetical protein
MRSVVEIAKDEVRIAFLRLAIEREISRREHERHEAKRRHKR